MTDEQSSSQRKVTLDAAAHVSAEATFDSTAWQMAIDNRPAKWQWTMFGDDNEPYPMMRVFPTFDVPLWRRVLTRILLGSTWQRLPPGER